MSESNTHLQRTAAPSLHMPRPVITPAGTHESTVIGFHDRIAEGVCASGNMVGNVTADTRDSEEIHNMSNSRLQLGATWGYHASTVTERLLLDLSEL